MSDVTLDPNEWTIETSIFEHGSWVVTIRPNSEPIWKDAIVGGLLHKEQAATVAQWLREGGLTTLWKIASNVLSEEGDE